jgi:hypothetical protein
MGLIHCFALISPGLDSGAYVLGFTHPNITSGREASYLMEGCLFSQTKEAKRNPYLFIRSKQGIFRNGS